MAPFIDWPEPHDASLGVPPSRQPGVTKVENITGRPETVLSEESFHGHANVQRRGLINRFIHSQHLFLGLNWVKRAFAVAKPDLRRSRDYGRHDIRRPLVNEAQEHGSPFRHRKVDGLFERGDGFGGELETDGGFTGVQIDGSHQNTRHEDSLTGYGANIDNAPMASTEGATSVVGDIVRDGADITPGTLTPVEKSAATGAADTSALADRPHPINRPESGAP